jgi:molybdopterin converting factor small subunit
VRINVVCFGALRDYLPDSAERNRAQVDLETGASVSDVVRFLGAPQGLVYALLIDGERAALDTELRDGAEVTLMPPFTGGAA